MPKSSLTKDEVKAMLILACDRVIAAEPQLSEADRNLGDGDHGLGMQRGMTAAKEGLEAGEVESIEKAFVIVGTKMMSSMGGASGAIFGTFFRNGGKALSGLESFDSGALAAFLQAGVDGVICVDIPPEEDPELGPALRAAGVSLIRLATPTTDAARLPAILEGSSGFLYYVSVAGITGKQQAAIGSIEENVARIKQHTDLPVAVGFGVRTPDQAEAIAKVADGVVVGSAIIDIIAEEGAASPAKVRDFVRSLRAAMDAVSKEKSA